MIPLLFAAHKILASFGIPGRKLGLELVEAKILQHVERKLEAAGDLAFNLLRRAEDMRVVLSKAAHAQQAVHHA